MNLPNELWYNVFYFLTQKSMSKFSCLWNLHNLSTEEIELIHRSIDLLIESAEKGYTKLIKLLIKAGSVNVNIQLYVGYTALHLASIHGRKEIVELLINAGADLNIQDNDGNTALYWASIRGHTECIELLIKAGSVNINIQNYYGKTALHEASRYGYKEIVELLIKAGVNVSIQSNNGYTALLLAAKFNQKTIIESLLNSRLIDNINFQDIDGNTAFHYVCQHGLKNSIKLLLDAGANVNIQDIKDNTPLHYVYFYNHHHCIDILLEAGANINARNFFGYKPNQVAKNSDEQVIYQSTKF